jgi:hypothetical protein
VGRIRLSIKIDQERAIALIRADRSQIAGNAGFPHTTLLIEYHPTHEMTSLVPGNSWLKNIEALESMQST